MIVITVKVWGSNTHKGTYFNTVRCDGMNLIAPWGMPAKTTDRFEVLETKGGYDSGDRNHAWTATYTLRLRLNKMPTFTVVGRQINGSSGYQILSKEEK